MVSNSFAGSQKVASKQGGLNASPYRTNCAPVYHVTEQAENLFCNGSMAQNALGRTSFIKPEIGLPKQPQGVVAFSPDAVQIYGAEMQGS